MPHKAVIGAPRSRLAWVSGPRQLPRNTRESAARTALAGANRFFEQRPHRDGKIGVRWLPVLQRLGLRVLQGTEYAAADGWLRPQRLAGRPDGLDPREVLGMDRLWRPSGERPDPRRTARQCNDVLADRNRRLIRATLLGEFPLDSDRRGPDACGMFDLPHGDFPRVQALGGAPLFEIGLLNLSV